MKSNTSTIQQEVKINTLCFTLNNINNHWRKMELSNEAMPRILAHISHIIIFASNFTFNITWVGNIKLNDYIIKKILNK